VIHFIVTYYILLEREFNYAHFKNKTIASSKCDYRIFRYRVIFFWPKALLHNMKKIVNIERTQNSESSSSSIRSSWYYQRIKKLFVNLRKKANYGEKSILDADMNFLYNFF